MEPTSKKTGFCIICRENNKTLSDEHVIPDAIGGVYHINNVCKDCNSKLGESVDKTLLSHWFTQAFRQTHKISGKKGHIPNPLATEGTLNDGTKVRLTENANGELEPHIIPSKPEVTKDGDTVNISFSVDQADVKQIDKIREKIFKRQGIDPKTYRIESTSTMQTIEQPSVRITTQIDMAQYKMGLLKIAYEFACDRLPSYLDDEKSKEYAEILRTCDFERLKGVRIGEKEYSARPLIDILRDLVDVSNKNRHYLLLFSNGSKLMCHISLCNCFSVVIEMSDKPYIPLMEMRIAINDFQKHTIQHFTLEELIEASDCKTTRTIIFGKESEEIFNRFSQAGKYRLATDQHDETILFDLQGNPITTIEQLMLTYPEEKVESVPLGNGESRHIYKLPPHAFVLMLPVQILLEVEGIEMLEKRQLI